MSETKENLAINELVSNILETKFENFDQATVEHAKNRIIDTLGCVIGGANAPGNSGLINLVNDWGGKEESTILVHGHKAPAHNVAMVNCIMARSFDFEPVSPITEGESWPGHVSGTTIPTALTMGEAKGVNGKELITALLVGDDTATRIMAASGFSFGGGWDNIGTVNAFGATAIAGRLLKLNHEQLRNAFGIVLNQLAGSLQIVWDKTTAFKICNGLSARNAIFSAQLALAGWSGPRDALLGQVGYYRLYTSGCSNPEILTKDLGRKYYSDGTIKPYPCCRINHAAIDCALALANKYDINVQDIEEIILYVSREGINSFCGEPFVIGNFPQANAIWSYRYNVGTALLRKSVKPEHFTEKFIRDPQVHVLMEKIKFAELPGADLYTARIELNLKDGRQLVETSLAAKGDPVKNPMSKKEIINKFWVNVDFSQTVPRKNAQQLLDLLDDLENLSSVDKIVELLSAY